MADFCFQCNIDMMFGPYSDFLINDFTTIELCEGCGPIYVKNGECVDTRCKDHAHPSDTAQRTYEHGRRYMRARRGPLAPLYHLWDRVRGTPWEPGLIHEVRYWWNTWRAEREAKGILVPQTYNVIPDFDPTNPNTVIVDGQDKTVSTMSGDKTDIGFPPEGERDPHIL